MHIRQVTLRGFMLHEDATFKLPDSGVVVLTGPNGVGKSALIEGVATAWWGKTLREGPSPWTGKPAEVISETDTLRVKRARKGRSTEVTIWDSKDGEWVQRGDEPMNATDANVLLAPLLMGWDVWKRACAFSSSDVAHFSLAGDKDQKSLIEDMLGLGMFEPAAKACRADLAGKKADLSIAIEKVRRLETTVESLQARIKDNEEYVGEEVADEAIVEVTKKYADFQLLANAVRGDQGDVTEELREADTKRGEIRARIAEIERTLDALSGDKCPTCSQTIPDALRDSLRAGVKGVRDALNAVSTVTIEAALEELDEEYDVLSAKARDAKARMDELKAARSRREQVAGVLKDCRARLVGAEEELEDAQAELVDTEQDVAELIAAEKVLGLKGVRAQVLANGLEGLDAVAATWMKRIAGDGFSVRLQAFTNTKTAGTNAKFSLVVEGAGGGSYKGASSGQRRRIDVALLFALSEMAAAARGETPGTLFVDEVFDALDDEGLAAVSNAIQDIAEERCVLVITHNKALVQALQPVRRWDLTPKETT
jgi:DNA repair exonuclease SbcCD ATPase subunit